MLLISHILIATASVLYTAYTFFAPSKNKLHVVYILIALTLLTGTYLIFTMPAHMAQTCQTGLVYLGVMLVGILAVRHRLAKI